MSSSRSTTDSYHSAQQKYTENGRSSATSPSERPSRSSGAKSGPTYEVDEEIEYEDEEEDDEDIVRRRSSSSSQLRGRKRSASIPMSPPSIGSDDDYYQDDRSPNIRVENVLGYWHFAPLLIAIVPPLGAVLGGGADAWSDAILLVIASFYLYQLLRVPHDFYHAARTRRVLNGDAESDVISIDDDPITREQKRERQAASAELKRAEIFSLAALVIGPVAGAWLLHWLMETFTDGNRYLNSFNIRLFMLASGIKPWSHAISLFRKRLLHLQEVVHYPSSRVESMNRRLGRMEADLSSLRKLVAMKTDVSLLRDGIDAPLTQLSRTMRRYEKKEEHLRMSAEDKFSLVESRLEDLLREVAINAELIEDERRARQKTVSLPYSIYQAIRYTLGQRSQESIHREQLLYDTPRSLPSSAHNNLAELPPSSQETGKSPLSSFKSNNIQQSTSSDSLPGYSSPPRYPQNHSITSTLAAAPSSYTPSWTEEGLAYWMFLPINVPKSVIRGALSFANNRVNETKDAGYARGFASVTGNGTTASKASQGGKIAASSGLNPSSNKARYPDVVSPRLKRRT